MRVFLQIFLPFAAIISVFLTPIYLKKREQLDERDNSVLTTFEGSSQTIRPKSTTGHISESPTARPTITPTTTPTTTRTPTTTPATTRTPSIMPTTTTTFTTPTTTRTPKTTALTTATPTTTPEATTSRTTTVSTESLTNSAPTQTSEFSEVLTTTNSAITSAIEKSTSQMIEITTNTEDAPTTALTTKATILVTTEKSTTRMPNVTTKKSPTTSITTTRVINSPLTTSVTKFSTTSSTPSTPTTITTTTSTTITTTTRAATITTSTTSTTATTKTTPSTTTTTTATTTTTTSTVMSCEDCPDGSFCFDIGEGIQCYTSMSIRNDKHNVYIYCGPDIDEAFNSKSNVFGSLGEPLQMSEDPHFLSLAPLDDKYVGFIGNYIIKTHAFDGRGAAAYEKNPTEKVFHKDTTGSQNIEEAWKFEKQCDDNAEACYKWKINAAEAHTSGYYMRAQNNDPHLYLHTINQSDDIGEFLWTIEFHY